MLKFIFLLALVLASGCSKRVTAETADTPAQSDASGSTVKVFRSRGSLQCAGGGSTPAVMQDALSKAGIAVSYSACGNDGLLHPAICGASDGRINIFSIPGSKLAQAQTLGFANLSSLPDAQATPCEQPVVYPVARVYKYRGSLQCSGGGTAPEVMQKELIGVGITVGAFSCGHDGLFRAAVCGSSDGKINIFHIPAGKIGEARSLGFDDLASLPSAAVTACPE
jgi:hypothetical protein